MNLVPLCSVNYNQLVVDGPTGVRLIVLLVDETSKTRLLQHYASIILPYCRYVVVVDHRYRYCSPITLFATFSVKTTGCIQICEVPPWYLIEPSQYAEP